MPDLKTGVRCCAVINFWCDGELLSYSIKQWQKLGVEPILVYSNKSNHGNVLNNTAFLKQFDVFKIQVEPLEGLPPMDNERRKRNLGLEFARKEGFTHIITSDVDELYETVDVDWEVAGTVVPCQTYFRRPDLTIGRDITLVPFVHKITPTLAYSFNRQYPFSWQGPSIRIDPTRSFNINSGVILRDDIVMHHYSYVRRDIMVKINNSSARRNMNVKQIMEDMDNAAPGYFCKTYQKVLYSAPNIFGLPTNW